MRQTSVLASLAILALTAPSSAETMLERGSYLVNTLAACANCHTSRTPRGPALAGGSKFGNGPTSVYAPNITPDKETGIGAWSDQQIAAAIHDGVRPDGSRLRAPMPQSAYRSISDADTRAIVAYLRSTESVHNFVPRTTPADQVLGESPVEVPVPGPLNNAVARGRYIATALSHCTECHTPALSSAPDAIRHLDEGGRIFQGPRGPVTAPGITAQRLSRYTDDQLASIITAGLLPDGRRIEGPMPVKAYAGISRPDLADLIAFLRDPPPETSK